MCNIFLNKIRKEKEEKESPESILDTQYCTKSQTTDGLKTLIRNKGVFHGIGKGIALLCFKIRRT